MRVSNCRVFILLQRRENTEEAAGFFLEARISQFHIKLPSLAQPLLSCSGDLRIIGMDQTIENHKLLSFLNYLGMVNNMPNPIKIPILAEKT